MSETKILVIAQHESGTLAVETLSTLTAAKELSDQSIAASIDVVIMGSECHQAANQLKGCGLINGLLVAADAVYDSQLAENCAQLISSCAQGYSHVLAPASTFGKDLMPRVAALLNVGMLSDIVAIESVDTIVRPIYAGNALARVQSHDAIKVMTVRSTAFERAVLSENQTVKKVQVDSLFNADNTQLVSREQVKSERPELANADVVISGGRGLGSKENFALVERLADKLGGAIGASRAAVDAGFVTNDLQVGQTGKIVAPRLYIAIGISGAIQHLAGMKDSSVIVAINSDPDAPIFEVADYGLVGDLFQLLPELIDAV